MKKLILAFLVVSVGFNVAFVAGYLRSQPAAVDGSLAMSSEQIGDIVAKRLGLNPQQRAEFIRLRNESERRLHELKTELAAREQEQWAISSGQDPPSAAALDAEISDLHRQMFEIRRETFRKFWSVLDDRQRQELRTRVGALRGFNPQRAGQLNDEERIQLRERMTRRLQGADAATTSPSTRWREDRRTQLDRQGASAMSQVAD
jgi:Mg/Co/Ni transporter MgtE